MKHTATLRFPGKNQAEDRRQVGFEIHYKVKMGWEMHGNGNRDRCASMGWDRDGDAWG